MSIDLLSPAPPGAPSAADRGASGPRTRPPGADGLLGGSMRPAVRPAVVAAVHLLCLGIVVAGSRIEFLRNSIRLDEAQSLWQTGHSYEALLRIVAQDVHVPLYHVVLRTWRLVLGPDIETARLLSLLFLLASVPVFYLVARKCLSTPWALFAVVLFSCSPFVQWYGNEARMYSMLVLVTLVSQYFFLTIVTTGRARTGVWAGYAASAVVGVYVHYFFLFVLVAQGLFLLGMGRRVPRGAVVRMAGVGLLVGAALAPWYLFFRANGSASETRPNLALPSSIDYANVYSQFLVGFQSDAINALVLSTWPLLVLAALASVRGGAKLGRSTAYLMVAAFVPVLLAFVASYLATPFFLSRYMIAALPALLIIMVRFVSGLTKPVAWAFAAALLAVTVLGAVVQAADPDSPVDEDYRAVAQVVEDGARPQDLVVLSSPFTIYPFEYYYDGTARIATLPAWDRSGPLQPFDSGTLPQDVDALTEGHQYIYLLLSYDQGYEEEVFQHFERNFQKVGSYAPSAGMRLLVYRVGYDDALPVGDR